MVHTGLKQPDGKQLYNSQLQWQINNGSKIEIDISKKREYLDEIIPVQGGNYFQGKVVYTGRKYTSPSIRGVNGQQLIYSPAEILMHELLVHACSISLFSWQQGQTKTFSIPVYYLEICDLILSSGTYNRLIINCRNNQEKNQGAFRV